MIAPDARVWTRSFVLAIATNFFISMVFHLLLTMMVLYALDRFQASDSAAGFASSSFVLGAMLARIFAGKYLDFVGRKRILVVSLVVYAVASAAYFAEGSMGLLLGLRIVHGFAFGIASTALAASVMGLLPPARRSEGAGYYGVSTTLAMAIGPLLALVLTRQFGYEGLFLCGLACSVVGLGFAFFLSLPERTPSPSELKAKWRVRPVDIVDPRALPFLTVMFVVGICFSGILTFLNAHTSNAGMGTASATFFIVYALTILVARTFVGRIHDAKGDNFVMYPALASLALGLGLLGIAPNGWVVGAAAVFAGLGFGSLHPGGQAIAVALVPLERVGVATSAFFLFLDLGAALGPFLAGGLIPFIGTAGMYVVLGGVMVASMALYHAVHGRRQDGRLQPG